MPRDTNVIPLFAEPPIAKLRADALRQREVVGILREMLVEDRNYDLLTAIDIETYAEIIVRRVT